MPCTALRRRDRQPTTGRAASTSPTGSARPRPRGPDADARAASARPRPRAPRADLRRPQARGARLRPHGPRPARHRALGPRRQAATACSVARLLGGFRTRLPTYASTYHGAGRARRPRHARRRSPTTPLACKEQGFAGFKIHGWHDGDARREAANLLGVRARGRRRLAADDRPGLPAAHLDGRALCRPRLRRGRLLLVRGPVSRRRRSRPTATSACARS